VKSSERGRTEIFSPKVWAQASWKAVRTASVVAVMRVSSTCHEG
jgi:hypothetical protein